MAAVIADNNELMKRYKETGDKALRNKLVLQYMGIVKYAAVSTRNMYCKFADTDDIINEATLGLMDAIDKFDTEKGVKFETFASIRVRGAIIDYIRRQDLIPRSIRKFSRDMNTVFSRLYTELGRDPTTEEMASEMRLSVDRYNSLAAQASPAAALSFEEMINGGFDLPDSSAEGDVWEAERNVYAKELSDCLVRSVDMLREQERTVVSLYYYEKLKLAEIAGVLGVSESRVCQIHSKAIAKLRHFMTAYMENKM